MESNAALRARRLAKPEWGMGSRRQEDWDEMMVEAMDLNRDIDFTFSHHYRGSGKWSRTEHNIAVPDRVSEGEHLAADKNIIQTVEVK